MLCVDVDVLLCIDGIGMCGMPCLGMGTCVVAGWSDAVWDMLLDVDVGVKRAAGTHACAAVCADVDVDVLASAGPSRSAAC